MKLKFHDHAVKRMQERKISLSEVRLIIEEPDGKIRQSRDKYICYRKLIERKDNLVAAVIIDDSRLDWVEVITVLINFEVRK